VQNAVVATRIWSGWLGLWKRAADPDEAGDTVFVRALLLTGAELVAALCILTLGTNWRVEAWGRALADLVPLPVKGTVLLLVPALYFGFVAANAFAQAVRGNHADAPARLWWTIVIALALSAGSGFLFWAVPVWLID
jgi:hypothetical protein